MHPEKLKLRKVNASDMKDLFNWRNHPKVRKSSFQAEPLLWEEHRKWFGQKIKSGDTVMFIGTYEDQKAGVIRFDNRLKDACVSVMLNPDYIGKGFGARLIELGVKKLRKQNNKVKTITAEIKEDNIASLKAFEKAGFQKSHVTYVLEL